MSEPLMLLLLPLALYVGGAWLWLLVCRALGQARGWTADGWSGFKACMGEVLVILVMVVGIIAIDSQNMNGHLNFPMTLFLLPLFGLVSLARAFWNRQNPAKWLPLLTPAAALCLLMLSMTLLQQFSGRSS